MKKTNIRLLLAGIVLMAAVATGCGSDYSNNSPGNQAPAGTAQGTGGGYP